MRSFACALGALLVAAASPAAAVTLVVGDNPLPGTTAADRPELAGTLLADRLVDYAFTVDGQTLSGTIQQSVLRSDLDGTLDFTWRVRPDGAGSLPLIAMRLGGFGNFITDGDWRSDGAGALAPTLARVFDGGFVNFVFDDPVGPSADRSSYFFFLKTTATSFNERGSYDLLCADTGCVTGSYATFAPAPEPATWAVMILGFGAVGAMLRRRRLALA